MGTAKRQAAKRVMAKPQEARGAHKRVTPLALFFVSARPCALNAGTTRRHLPLAPAANVRLNALRSWPSAVKCAVRGKSAPMP
eukprot:scaffold31893_cov129-Isochrysis_galbana.AAC.3